MNWWSVKRGMKNRGEWNGSYFTCRFVQWKGSSKSEVSGKGHILYAELVSEKGTA